MRQLSNLLIKNCEAPLAKVYSIKMGALSIWLYLFHNCWRSAFEVLENTFLNSCAIQICKNINQTIYNKRFCGCKISWMNVEYLVLSQDEKNEFMYFDEGLGLLDLNAVKSDFMRCVADAL